MSGAVLIETTMGAEETTKLGERLGRALKGGEVIELVGDVGSGKTTLVKGIVAGCESRDVVTSPTFVLKNVYEGRLRINHLDLYRLSEPGLLGRELAETAENGSAVTIIEWGESLKDALPKARVRVEIRPAGDETREIKLHIPDELKYLRTTIK